MLISLFLCIFIFFTIEDVTPTSYTMFDLQYWECTLKQINHCPDKNVKFYVYAKKSKYRAKQIDVRNPRSLVNSGWDVNKKNVIIIHGFNGTESKSPVTILKRAYIQREDYNIFTIDWEKLTKFPCYLSALSNTRLVGKCGAQLYAHITKSGALAKKITCVGHSLGAHICGMMTNFLDIPQHRIIGLDPARPLISKYADKFFRLTRDDANLVQIIHTNAGSLGDVDQIGHVDFCVNNGMFQPGCLGHRLYRARCSHFQSVCYFARTLNTSDVILGRACTNKCPNYSTNKLLYGPVVPMGENTPENARGMYCVQISQEKDCPFK